MSEERERFVARIDELGGLYEELQAHVREGRWRRAAEIAGLREALNSRLGNLKRALAPRKQRF